MILKKHGAAYWQDEASRVNAEHNDPAFRPAIAGELPDLSTYDTVFIGYPIWWGEAPSIVWTLYDIFWMGEFGY